MANQTKVKIAGIPEGQLFKWNRVVYKNQQNRPTKHEPLIPVRAKKLLFTMVVRVCLLQVNRKSLLQTNRKRISYSPQEGRYDKRRSI